MDFLSAPGFVVPSPLTPHASRLTLAGIPLNIPAGCAFGLVADEEQIVFGVFKAGLEMVDDPAAGAHAAPGDDHCGAGPLDQPEMIPVGAAGEKPLEIQRMVAPLQEASGFPVPVGGKGGGDPGQFEVEGGIHHHGNASQSSELRHASPEGGVGDQPVRFVEQFLGAAEGESGDEDLAAVGERAPEDLSEPFQPMFAAFVEAWAISRRSNGSR